MPVKDQDQSMFNNAIILTTSSETIGTIPSTGIVSTDPDPTFSNLVYTYGTTATAQQAFSGPITMSVDAIGKAVDRLGFYRGSDSDHDTKKKKKKKKDEPKYPSMPVEYKPIKILRNGPATIVFWGGPKHEKTVVKCPEEKEYDLYEAFTAAFAIRMFGNNNHLKKTIAKLFKEEKA